MDDLDDALQANVYNLIDKGIDMDAFLALASKLTLAWEANWQEVGPYRVEATNVKQFDTPQVMVNCY